MTVVLDGVPVRLLKLVVGVAEAVVGIDPHSKLVPTETDKTFLEVVRVIGVVGNVTDRRSKWASLAEGVVLLGSSAWLPSSIITDGGLILNVSL